MTASLRPFLETCTPAQIDALLESLHSRRLKYPDDNRRKEELKSDAANLLGVQAQQLGFTGIGRYAWGLHLDLRGKPAEGAGLLYCPDPNPGATGDPYYGCVRSHRSSQTCLG
jgi:hypothetical protein